MSTNSRVHLENGGWFDISKAIEFKEDTWFNGNNMISVATGSQWEHEALYRTANGNWILNCWSQYQGVRETYEQIDQETAINWLIKNDRIDSDVSKQFAEEPDLVKQIESALSESEV